MLWIAHVIIIKSISDGVRRRLNMNREMLLILTI